MPESFIQLAPDSTGKKAHSFQRVIGANTVEDEVVLHGEPYLATYSMQAKGILLSTVNDHILAVMAGASLKLRIRKITIFQNGLAGAVNTAVFAVLRLTSAGTGGGAVTAVQYDQADGAAGATGMTLPTAKGTESAELTRLNLPMVAAQPAGNKVEWIQLPNQKPLMVAAGTANGIAIKSLVAVTSPATVNINIEFDEANF